MAAEKTFQAWWARYSYRFEPGRILENSARTCWNDAAKLSEDSKTSTNTASPKLPSWEEVVRYSNLKPGSVIDDPMEFLHDIYGFIFRQLQA